MNPAVPTIASSDGVGTRSLEDTLFVMGGTVDESGVGASGAGLDGNWNRTLPPHARWQRLVVVLDPSSALLTYSCCASGAPADVLGVTSVRGTTLDPPTRGTIGTKDQLRSVSSVRLSGPGLARPLVLASDQPQTIAKWAATLRRVTCVKESDVGKAPCEGDSVAPEVVDDDSAARADTTELARAPKAPPWQEQHEEHEKGRRRDKLATFGSGAGLPRVWQQPQHVLESLPLSSGGRDLHANMGEPLSGQILKEVGLAVMRDGTPKGIVGWKIQTMEELHASRAQVRCYYKYCATATPVVAGFVLTVTCIASHRHAGAASGPRVPRAPVPYRPSKTGASDDPARRKASKRTCQTFTPGQEEASQGRAMAAAFERTTFVCAPQHAQSYHAHTSCVPCIYVPLPALHLAWDGPCDTARLPEASMGAAQYCCYYHAATRAGKRGVAHRCCPQ